LNDATHIACDPVNPVAFGTGMARPLTQRETPIFDAVSKRPGTIANCAPFANALRARHVPVLAESEVVFTQVAPLTHESLLPLLLLITQGEPTAARGMHWPGLETETKKDLVALHMAVGAQSPSW